MATMNTSQRLPFVLDPKLADGVTSAPVDGLPVYASSDETIARVVVDPADPTGKTGWFESVAASANLVRMSITADADLGAGVVTLTGVSEDVTVSQDPATQASVLTFSFAPAVPKA